MNRSSGPLRRRNTNSNSCFLRWYMFLDESKKNIFYGNKTLTGMNAAFHYYNGVEQKRLVLERGQTLTFSYNLETIIGKLYISIIDEEGNILETRYNHSGNVTIEAETKGNYFIKVIGVGATGSYRLDWSSSQNW